MMKIFIISHFLWVENLWDGLGCLSQCLLKSCSYEICLTGLVAGKLLLAADNGPQFLSASLSIGLLGYFHNMQADFL
jgi:hypothetical protein